MFQITRVSSQDSGVLLHFCIIFALSQTIQGGAFRLVIWGPRTPQREFSRRSIYQLFWSSYLCVLGQCTFISCLVTFPAALLRSKGHLLGHPKVFCRIVMYGTESKINCLELCTESRGYWGFETVKSLPLLRLFLLSSQSPCRCAEYCCDHARKWVTSVSEICDWLHILQVHKFISMLYFI